MQKRTKLSIIFILSFFILILVAFLFAKNWTESFNEYLKENGTVEYAKVNDVVITETKEGNKEWELYSAIAEYNTDKTIVTLKDIVGNYYKDNEVNMSFISPYGTYNTETKEVQLFDNVKIIGKGNIKLSANKISWITTENIIKAEGSVVINQNNEIIALSDKAIVTKDLVNISIIENTEIRVYKDMKDKRGI